MDALKRSDFWFGIVLAVFFGLAAFVFFGSAATNSVVWLNVIVVVGFAFLGSSMRNPLDQLDRMPRFVSWFSIGVTLAVVLAAVGERPTDLVQAVFFGAFLGGISLLPARPDEDSGYREEGR